MLLFHFLTSRLIQMSCHVKTITLPAYLRWMYSIEHYMNILEGYVKNWSQWKGCIIERFIVEETVEFCTQYLSNVEPIWLLGSHNLGKTRKVSWWLSQTLNGNKHIYMFSNMLLIFLPSKLTITSMCKYSFKEKRWLNIGPNTFNKAQKWQNVDFLYLIIGYQKSIIDYIFWISQI